jgi:DNA-binding IclR family transcriptional regulator
VPVGSLTPGLRKFIAQYLRTVEQVEILCILSSRPTRGWTVAEVFRPIQSSEKSVTDCLENFRENDLMALEPDGRYRLAPKTLELAEFVSELAAAYRERRVAVIETIHGKSTDTIQDFANAFKLRKEK